MSSPYTYGQQVLLALIPKCTGSIGITCSLLLLSEIVRDYIRDPSDINPIKRALVVVCFYEIMDSIGWFLSSWMIPSSENFFGSSNGTWGTCNFQGFLLQIAIGGPLCNGLLTFVFYTVVKGYDWHTVNDNEKRWSRMNYIEMYYYIFVVLYTFGTGFLLLGLQTFNPLNHVCTTAGYPLGCNEAIFLSSTLDIPCERGANSQWLGLFLFYVVLWIVWLVVIYLNFSMRNTLIAIRQQSAQQQSDTASISTSGTEANNDDVQWLTQQALLFSLAFILTWLPSTLWFVIPTFFGTTAFWLDIFSATFEPLLGFWNLLIFLRNRPDSVQRIKHYFLCCFNCYTTPYHNDTNSSISNEKDVTNNMDISHNTDR
jgi:hypothetical protein